ncbi:MAG TPA: bacillithiol biosynthesis BshC, partial [Planctomycetota bacterium]|nr:bacillithiol biosynthesis BshC [Planctomycetota bacterium]
MAPEEWFHPARYRPRVETPVGDRWFLRAGVIPFVRGIPDELPIPHPARPSPRDVAAAFEATYERWGVPRSSATRRNLERVADPETLYVVAGQQPGLFSGPLYTIYKAVTCIAMADALEHRFERPVVPVFWVAGEDHDLDEVRWARIPGPDDSEVELRLPWPSDRRPVSDYILDGSADEVIELASSALANRRHAGEARALLELYRGGSLCAGFARFIEALLGDRGLLIIDPEELRPLAAPLFERVLASPADALARIEAGCEIPRRAGLSPFVRPRLPLFVLVDEGEPSNAKDGTSARRTRHHLTVVDGDLAIDGDGPPLTARDIRALFDRDPRRLSAGALLRPLVQSFVLPTALTIGGPSEIGYFSQLPPLADLLEVEPPRIGLRLQATVINGKAARLRSRLGIGFDTIARATSPEELVIRAGDDELEGAGKRLEEAARQLRERIDARGFRDDARRRLERGYAKAESAIASLLGRIDRELRQEDEESFAAARSLWHHLFPG